MLTITDKHKISVFCQNVQQQVFSDWFLSLPLVINIIPTSAKLWNAPLRETHPLISCFVVYKLKMKTFGWRILWWKPRWNIPKTIRAVEILIFFAHLHLINIHE